MAGFNISTPNDVMEIIYIDGGNSIVPTTASEIEIIYPGERIDVIVSHLNAEDISITLDPEYDSQVLVSFHTLTSS